jgi:hypothetical protein
MARGASSVQREISMAHRQLVAATRTLTGADSDAVKGAARVLQNAIRKQLSVAAPGRRTSLKTRRTYGGTPSQPGQSPHLQSGRARRSVKNAAVDGFRRVGTDDFKLRLLELGVVADAKPARKTGKARAGRSGRVATLFSPRKLVIEPRPSFEPALAACKDQMTEVMVAELGRRVSKKLARGA